MNNFNEVIIIEFDDAIYSEQAIKNACYDYSNEFAFSLSKKGQKTIVEFKPIISGSGDHTKLNQFMNHVLDHQVRIDTAREFKTIREMIVAQAFQPCENIDEVVSHIVQNEK